VTAEMSFTRSYLAQLEDVLRALPREPIAEFIRWMSEARTHQRSVFAIGNGGSAATASHLATDVGKGASLDRPQRFRIVSLTDNVPWITALGNDLEYADIFVEQLRNLAQPEDLLIAISVSGNSPNVVKAVEWAKAHACRTVGLVGAKGGRLKDLADLPIVVPTEHFGRAEDAHLVICHIVSYFFMEQPS
jgi:D-sedoheptulose 7-phosphate isomerase